MPTHTLPDGIVLNVEPRTALELRLTRQQAAIRGAASAIRRGDLDRALQLLDFGEAELGSAPPRVMRDLAHNRPSAELDHVS